MSALRHPAAAVRTRLATGACLLAILVAGVVPRLPVLHSAAFAFNSDEAVNALVIKHLLEGKELTLHNWDAGYYGIVEGLLAVPFVWIDGYTPLAFKLSALVGFLAMLVATFWLGRRLYGRAEGLTAAALLAVFSPSLVLWSTLASGGYTLVIAWGSLTLAVFEALRRASRPLDARRLALFGVMVGFGLYIYELYLLYALLLAGYAASVSFLWQALRAPSAAERRAALGLAPRQLGGVAAILAGLAVGWAPKLVALATGATGSKRPLYDVNGPAQMLANLRLLVGRCVPAFFGTNPGGSPEVAQWVGAPWPSSTALGVLLLAFFAAAYLLAVRGAWPRLRGALGRPPLELDARSLLVLLVPLTAALFVLSPNPQDTLSNRYLLPWLSALPVFAAATLVRLGRRAPLAAVAAGAFLVVFPAVQVARTHVLQGYLGPDLRPVVKPEPLEDVVRYLRQRGVRGAYGSYWTAYEATFLSGETVLVAPLLDWDRYPAYTRAVERLPTAAYIFAGADRPTHERFREHLARRGARYEMAQIDGYRVYTSPRGDRLLPSFAFATPTPIAHPRARITARQVPATARAGEVLEIPVSLTNSGSDPWSAAGIGQGTYRVAVSYRWLDERGAPVVVEGERSLLPDDVPPGGSAELVARVPAPAAPGSYQLVLTLVQESVAWFDQVGGGAVTLPVRITR